MKIKPPLVLLALIVFLNLFVLTRLVFFPYPELFVYPFLANHGFVAYKQIFDQHMPLLLMTPVNFATLGLTSPISARVYLLFTVTFSHLLIYLVGLKIFKRAQYALVANVVFLITQPLFEGYILWLDSFLTPILLAGLYFLLRFFEKERVGSGFLAGFFLGVLLSFKQVLAPLALAVIIYLFLRKKSAKLLLPVLVGVAVPLIATLFWVIRQGVLPEFIYWTTAFNFEVYAKMGRKLPGLSQAIRVLVYFAPAIYFILLNFKKRFQVQILGLFLIISPILALSRFEFIHLQPTLALVALGTSGLIFEMGGKIKTFLLTIFILAMLVWLPKFYRSHVGGLVYFFDENTLQTASRVKNLSRENDGIFVLGAQPVIYPLADRLPAGRLFSVSVPWNMVVVEDKILEALKNNPPALVVRDSSATIDQKRVIDFEAGLNEFVEENYQKIDQLGPNEILVPKIRTKNNIETAITSPAN